MKDIYYKKYLKYKLKYLHLSSSLKLEGGEGYKNTTNINDYKKITWHANSCYFSVAMWFLWTVIPFREFIYNYSDKNPGFIAIKNLFNEFNNESFPEPVNITKIYQEVFEQFVTSNINGRSLRFGEQESSGYLIEKILEQTKNDDFLNKIRLKETSTTKCKDDKSTKIKIQEMITIPTNNTNIFTLQTEIMEKENAIDRCIKKDPTDYGSKIIKYDLFFDTNQYFIIEFSENKIYSDVSEIIYNGKIFKIKSVVSYLGEVSKKGGKSGHYVCYVFDDDGLNPFVLDDLAGKKEKINDLNAILINSLVLYKLVDSIEPDIHRTKPDRIEFNKPINKDTTELVQSTKESEQPSIKSFRKHLDEYKNTSDKYIIGTNKDQYTKTKTNENQKKTIFKIEYPSELKLIVKNNMDEIVKKLKENKTILQKKIDEENNKKNYSQLDKLKKRFESINEHIIKLDKQIKIM